MKDISISASFRKRAIQSIFAIILFIFTYVLMILFGIGLTLVCGYFGLMLVDARINVITIIVCVGLISIGLLTLIFLLKFLGGKDVEADPSLQEITREDAPALYQMISEIVKEVDTSFPKKIFITPEVNAAVFYDSGFWSMILPVRKNLRIGMGLVNSVSRTEFKAILAHEFGHFSQQSMKVGSYVYNVNQVIHNMLFDNESFNSLAQSWANVNGYLSFFVRMAVGIVRGLQFILRKVYEVVNVSYMGLSREMEYHADEVAANVTGSKPLITSLLRLELAEFSYNTVLEYYNGKIKEAVTTQNLYPQHRFVMNFLASENDLPMENNFAKVGLDQSSRYNKSKLVLTNQWASHPSIKDRVERLEMYDAIKTEEDGKSALGLFSNIESIQDGITTKLFSTVTYAKPVNQLDEEGFNKDFTNNYRLNSFDKIFLGYYDNKNPSVVEVKPGEVVKEGTSFKTLFNDANTETVYTYIGVENDLAILKQIAEGKTGIKSFDYDGMKYDSYDTYPLISFLEGESKRLKGSISENDKMIYLYFNDRANKVNKVDEWIKSYKAFINYEKEFEGKFEHFTNMVKETMFIQLQTPINVILDNFESLEETEGAFKTRVRHVLDSEIFQPDITEEIRVSFRRYVNNRKLYFADNAYNQEILDLMINALTNYQVVLTKTFTRIKRELITLMLVIENDGRLVW